MSLRSKLCLKFWPLLLVSISMLSGCQNDVQQRIINKGPSWSCVASENKGKQPWECQKAADGKTAAQIVADSQQAPVQNTVAEEQTPVSVEPSPTSDQPEDQKQKAVTSVTPAETKRLAKRVSFPRDGWAIQAVATSTQDGMFKTFNEYGQSRAWYIQTNSNGKRWHILVLSIYPTREAAELALSLIQTPDDLPSPWIRPIKPLIPLFAENPRQLSR